MIWFCAWLLLAIYANAQNSMVGDGFGGRLWYQPTNYSVGSYSAYSICYSGVCGEENQLYGWGSNNSGQLGYSSDVYGFPTPTPIPLMTDVKYYSTGYAMGAIKNDNTGWVWGVNMPSYTPSNVIADVKFLDGSMFYVSFVKNDGTVWSIGQCNFGEFGNGELYQYASAPVQMNSVNNAVRVACGASTTYVLLSNGKVKAVGSNANGLLGIGNDVLTESLSIVDVQGLSDVVDIKANTIGVIALTASGNVYTWGDQGAATYFNQPTLIDELENIVSISACADGYHFLALDEDGNCFGWGLDPSVFGLVATGPIISPIVVATEVIDIMAGEWFSYIVKSDGTLWASGWANTPEVSIWLNLPPEVGHQEFVQLDPSLVLGTCVVQSTLVTSSYSCTEGGSIEINNIGGNEPFAYDIGEGVQSSNVFSGLIPGTYQIDITDANGCIEEVDVVVVPELDSPFPFLGEDLFICSGESITLQAPDTWISYLWNTGETLPSIEINTPGVYYVTVETDSCYIADAITVINSIPTDFNIGNDIYACTSIDTLLIAPFIENATYEWSNGDISASTIVNSPGIHWCTVSLNDCQATDTIQYVTGAIKPKLRIPNVFTPNSDSFNDYFEIQTENISQFSLRIFNRWGALLFESDKADQSWNGKFNSEEVGNGVYYYILTYQNECNGEILNAQGFLSLLR